MKCIQCGDEYHLDNDELCSDECREQWDDYLKRRTGFEPCNVEKETKVYYLECDDDEGDFNFRELERKGELLAIMQEATKRGCAYTLQEFQDLCNNNEIWLGNAFILIR